MIASLRGLDGPALRLRIARKAPLRHPLSRIARVTAGEPAGYPRQMRGKPSRLDTMLLAWENGVVRVRSRG